MAILSVAEIKATIKKHNDQLARNEKYLDDAQRRIEKRKQLIAKYTELLEKAQNPPKSEPVPKKSAKAALKAEKPVKSKNVKKDVEQATTKPAKKLSIKKPPLPTSSDE